MSGITSNNPQPPLPDPTNITTTGTQKVQGTTGDTTQPINPLLGVLIALLGTTENIQQLTQVHSTSIQANASQQEQLNTNIGELQYAVLPTGATQDQVTSVDSENQNIQFERSNIQQTVTVLRQTAQSEMQQVTSLTDAMQQTTSGTSAVLKLMGTVLKLINQISQPK